MWGTMTALSFWEVKSLGGLNVSIRDLFRQGRGNAVKGNLDSIPVAFLWHHTSHTRAIKQTFRSYPQQIIFPCLESPASPSTASLPHAQIMWFMNCKPMYPFFANLEEQLKLL